MRVRAFVRGSAVVVSVMLAVGACGDSGTDRSASPSAGNETVADGGEIVVAMPHPVSSWDGNTFDSTWDRHITNLVAETLIQESTDGELVPGIADSWELSDDNKVLTVTLREDVTFSDGSPLDAADVTFSYDHWTGAEANATLISPVTSVEAGADDRTVVFTSEVPNGFLPYALSYGVFGIYPEDFGGRTEGEYLDDPIGAGPFVVESQHRGAEGIDEIVLVPNDNYYGEAPKLDRITFRHVLDGTQQALQFTNGELDVVREVSFGLVDQFPEDSIQYLDNASMVSLWCSWRSTPWCSQPEFRRAVSMAIDREQLLEGYWQGHAEVANRFVAEELIDSPGPRTGDWTTYDPDEARRLLEGIGYDGDEVTLDFIEDPGWRVLSEALAEMLGEVGINVKPVAYPDNAAYGARIYGESGTGGDYELAMGGVSGIVNHPGEVIIAFAEYNWYTVGGPLDVAEEFRLATIAAATPEDVGEVMADVEQWGYDNTIMIPLAQPKYVVAVNPRLRGYEQNHVGVWRPADWYLVE
jgi:peptide/nickel transport system substrate-binding protein